MHAELGRSSASLGPDQIAAFRNLRGFLKAMKKGENLRFGFRELRGR
jgi:hypothetical protein